MKTRQVIGMVVLMALLAVTAWSNGQGEDTAASGGMGKIKLTYAELLASSKNSCPGTWTSN